MSNQDSHLDRLHKSRFYKRMIAARDLPGTNVTELETVVKLVCENVSAVTTRVSTYFHAYTLHDMTHLWNVIDIMEELVPPAVWSRKWKKATDRLGPFQCALSLMAALVHDLGMAPPEELTNKLEAAEDLDLPIPNDADRDFVAYRRHYASREDDVRAIRTLRSKENVTEAEKNADEKEILRRKQMIRTDYLRITHSDDTISGTSRIRNWLERFQPASNYTYGNWPYLDLLVNVAMSHAHSGGLAWLENQLVPKLIVKRQAENASGLHVAWLLRLADILDLDASRAPAVLYRNFPPNNNISDKHWMQHLCISERVPDWDATPPTIEFLKGKPCRNPEIDKALRDYCCWIRDEVVKVEESQVRHSSVKDQFPIRLPGSQLNDQGRPRFIQLDPTFKIEGGWSSEPVRFELSQADVVKILMGEELYGEPELCLREVIQNALDATHLRWLRYELRQRMVDKLGEEAYAKYDLPPADVSLNKDDLEIKVSWGVGKLPDDGWRATSDDMDDNVGDERHWIEIEDPGTGMTVEVVKKYFTQIGRSYYQSPEYRRDRALLQEYELSASEISQFGIGILSCFMLADMVEVWTCPIRAHESTDNDKPQHYRIWGAEGLFWHQPTEEKTSPGTRIRMWLKKGRIVTCRPEALEYTSQERESSQCFDSLDPVRELWECVFWPRYAIRFVDNNNDLSDWSITPTSSLAKSFPINTHHANRMLDWIHGQPQTQKLSLSWAWFDWEHVSTASRIRVAAPVDGEGGGCTEFGTLLDLLAKSGSDVADVGPTQPFAFDSCIPPVDRTQLLVRGFRVADLEDLAMNVPIAADLGCIVIIDASGHASPNLRADRKAETGRQRPDWQVELERMFASWIHDACESVLKADQLAIAQTIIKLRHSTWQRQCSVHAESGMIKLEVVSQKIQWFRILCCEHRVDLGFDSRPMPRPRKRGFRRLESAFRGRFGGDSTRDATLTRAIDGVSRVTDFKAHRAPYIDLALSIAVALLNDDDLHPSFSLRRMRRGIGIRPSEKQLGIPTVRSFLSGANLPELFSDSLLNSLPCLQAPIAIGSASHARLISPAQMQFQIERPCDKDPPRATEFASGWHNAPGWLEEIGYDLVGPWTQIPIGELRSACPAWRSERSVRAFAMLPFLLSSMLNWREFHSLLKTLDNKIQLSRVADILLLVVDDSIQSLPFAKWEKEATEHGVLSAYWNIYESKVLWARGFHTRASIRNVGQTIEQLTGTDWWWL